jgi:hypothetical protein
MENFEQRLSSLEADIKRLSNLYNNTSHQSIEDENTIAIGCDSSYQAIRKEGAIAIGGNSALQVSQGKSAIALGSHSAYKAVQGSGAIAIGDRACSNGIQGSSTIAIGPSSCKNGTQGNNAIAIGPYSAYCSKQGQNTIAIGYGAGAGYQKANSIILHAGGKTQLSENEFVVFEDGMTTPDNDGHQDEGGFYVKPIRYSRDSNDKGTQLFYNQKSGEIYTAPSVLTMNLRKVTKTDDILNIGYDRHTGELVTYDDDYDDDYDSESSYSTTSESSISTISDSSDDE